MSMTSWVALVMGHLRLLGAVPERPRLAFGGYPTALSPHGFRRIRPRSARRVGRVPVTHVDCVRPEAGPFVDGERGGIGRLDVEQHRDRKSTRLNSSHANISYAVFCLKKKKQNNIITPPSLN